MKINPNQYKQYKTLCYKRCLQLNFKCQICGTEVYVSNDWHFDRIFFDHVLPRDKCNEQEFLNGFLFVHSEFHEFRTHGYQRKHFCPQWFMSEGYYYRTAGGKTPNRLFYKTFLERHPGKLPIKIEL